MIDQNMDDDSQVEPTTDEATSKPDGSEKESTQVKFKESFMRG